jgi:hypothetical protein
MLLSVLASVALALVLASHPAHAQATTDDSQSPSLANHPSDLQSRPSTIKGAIADSLRLLLVEHTTRIAFQPKTRRELGGPFLGDYRCSLKFPTAWGDRDGWAVNYIGHPIHGGAAGFIWLDHADGSDDPRLGFSLRWD